MTNILELPFLHVDEISAEVDLVAELRRLNAEGVDIPWVWTVGAGYRNSVPPNRVTLKFGVNNTVGALMWTGDSQRLVPANGTNVEWTTYYLAGVHDTSIPPSSEVPINLVFAALTEFLDTHTRPACVKWKQAASIESMAE